MLEYWKYETRTCENRMKPRMFEKKRKNDNNTYTLIELLEHIDPDHLWPHRRHSEAAPEGVKYSNDRGRRKHENDRARKRNCGWAECAHSFRGSTHAWKPFDLYIEVNVAERERENFDLSPLRLENYIWHNCLNGEITFVSLLASYGMCRNIDRLVFFLKWLRILLEIMALFVFLWNFTSM